MASDDAPNLHRYPCVSQCWAAFVYVRFKCAVVWSTVECRIDSRFSLALGSEQWEDLRFHLPIHETVPLSSGNFSPRGSVMPSHVQKRLRAPRSAQDGAFREWSLGRQDRVLRKLHWSGVSILFKNFAWLSLRPNRVCHEKRKTKMSFRGRMG